MDRHSRLVPNPSGIAINILGVVVISFMWPGPEGFVLSVVLVLVTTMVGQGWAKRVYD